MPQEINFYEVLERLIKDNKRVHYLAKRASWEGNKHIYLAKGKDIKSEDCYEENLKRLSNEKDVHIMQRLDMVDNGFAIMGWTPSTEDLFADDWYII